MTTKMILYVVGGIILSVLLYWGYMQLPSKPTVAQDMIDQKVTELKKEYEEALNVKKGEIARLNNELEVYKSTGVLLRKEIERLKGRKDKIKEPQTFKETKESFEALGYNPI